MLESMSLDVTDIFSWYYYHHILLVEDAWFCGKMNLFSRK